jgi:hypothetical protein
MGYYESLSISMIKLLEQKWIVAGYSLKKDE